jgi:hypothetical protein
MKKQKVLYQEYLMVSLTCVIYLKSRCKSIFVVLQYLYMDTFSKAIYNSFKLIGLYPSCHISYLFIPRPGLFNNGVRTYGVYLSKGETLYEVFILLVCLNLLHIDDGCIPPHLMQECLSKQLAFKHPFIKLLITCRW